MTLGRTLRQAAQKWPHKNALVFEGRRWTYRAWNREANRAANAFAARGIALGDRVAVLSWNRPDQVTAFYGLLKIGAVPVPINYRLAANEIRYIVENSGARLFLYEDGLRDTVAPVLDDLTALEARIVLGAAAEAGETAFEDFIAPAREDEPAETAGLADPAFIMYTSGTTGRPKGVVRSHRAELFGAMIMAMECGFRHTDSILNNKPLYHIAQLQLQFVPFVLLGGTNVMTRGFDVEETLSVVAAERIACLHSVPTQMVMMAEADLERYDLSSLRCGFYGGQTLADEIIERLMPLFPDSFLNVYGSTEALALTACDYRRQSGRIGSVGQAAHACEVRIVAPGAETADETVPAGTVGELIARAPSLFERYHGMPERSAAALRGGWYLSGDSAWADADGFVTVLGRNDDTIKSGAENIHPSEIENLLFAHPGIADAAVVGLDSKRWGQVPCAAIVARDRTLDAAALDAYCRASPDLADFKRPRHYVFVDEIPANPTGKVERNRLRQRLGAHLRPPLD